MIAGGLAYAALGEIGRLLGGRRLFGPAALAMLVGAAVWHGLGGRAVPFGRVGVQANRDLAFKGPWGIVYFGALLGIGLLTQMSTPLVYGGAVLSMASGAAGGFIYGAGFGLGRSLPALGAALRGTPEDPSTIARFFTESVPTVRWLGASVAVIACVLAGSLI